MAKHADLSEKFRKAKDAGDAQLMVALVLVEPTLASMDKTPEVLPHVSLQNATQSFLAAQKKVERAFDRAANLRLQSAEAEKEARSGKQGKEDQ